MDKDLGGEEKPKFSLDSASYKIWFNIDVISHLIMKRHVVFDKSKHLDFEAPHMGWVTSMVLRHNRIEHDLVALSWICTANCKAASQD